MQISERLFCKMRLTAARLKGEAQGGRNGLDLSTLLQIRPPRSTKTLLPCSAIFTINIQNCDCCPVSLYIARLLPLPWFEVLNCQKYQYVHKGSQVSMISQENSDSGSQVTVRDAKSNLKSIDVKWDPKKLTAILYLLNTHEADLFWRTS